MLIKIVLLLFVIFTVSRLVKKFRQRAVNGRELILWLIFWLAVAAAIVWPQKTDIIARWVGVGRGADLLVYVSILALFYAFFRLSVSDKKKQREITELTRHLALKNCQRATPAESANENNSPVSDMSAMDLNNLDKPDEHK